MRVSISYRPESFSDADVVCSGYQGVEIIG